MERRLQTTESPKPFLHAIVTFFLVGNIYRTKQITINRIHLLVLCLPDSWWNWNLEMLIFKERNQQQLKAMASTLDRNLGTMVGGERSHHCATLFPQTDVYIYICLDLLKRG